MDNVPANLRFYEFVQNNSGGSFDTNHAKGIGQRVWIQATSADHANDVAEKIGLYFDGCTDGKDCNCCGDRWSRVDEHDAVENIPVNDTVLPFAHSFHHSRLENFGHRSLNTGRT